MRKRYNESEKLSTTTLKRLQKIRNRKVDAKLQDQTEDFPKKVLCRLMNPSKSDIDWIRKIINNEINENLVTSTLVKQWKKPQFIINWYAST